MAHASPDLWGMYGAGPPAATDRNPVERSEIERSRVRSGCRAIDGAHHPDGRALHRVRGALPPGRPRRIVFAAQASKVDTHAARSADAGRRPTAPNSALLAKHQRGPPLSTTLLLKHKTTMMSIPTIVGIRRAITKDHVYINEVR